MKFMNRLLAALLIALVSGFLQPAVCLSPQIALGEEEDRPDLDISVTVDPDEMVEPGEVTLSFTVVNRTSDTLERLYLSTADGELIEDIGNIAPDETKKFTCLRAVSQEALNAGGIETILTCVSGRDHFSYPVRAEIVKAAAEPQVEFLRRASSQRVSPDARVALVYQIHNVGNVSINNITVTDPLGAFEKHLDLLAAGASTTFIQHVPVKSIAESAPVLTYSTVAGSYTEALEGLPLSRARTDLKAVLTAAPSDSEETARASLRLTNGGNVDYRNISVIDDVYGGIIADSLSLAAGGEPLDVDFTYPLRNGGEYRWRITAQTSAGDRVDFVTNTVILPAPEPKKPGQLSLSASTDMPKISRKGQVPVRLEISTDGGAVQNAVLSEEKLGDLYTFALVPAGEPTLRSFIADIRGDTVLNFSIRWTDARGETQTASAEPLSIDIGRGGVMPLEDDSSPSFFDGLSTQIHQSKLFMVLFYSSIAVLVVLLGVLIVAAHRQRSQRRERDAARKQRIKEDMAKTAPFQPLRRSSENKK